MQMHPLAMFFIALALGGISIYQILEGMMLIGVASLVIAIILLAFTLPRAPVKKKKQK